MKRTILNSVSFIAVATLFAAGASAADNRSDLIQRGNGNAALVEQITTLNGGPTAPTGASSVVNQNGDRNSAAVAQSGNNEVARVTQSTSDNRAEIKQLGSAGSISQINQESASKRKHDPERIQCSFVYPSAWRVG